jgi:hypothetical protein
VARAFIRLNGGRLNLETAEQTKSRVASLLKVLRIRSLGRADHDGPKGGNFAVFATILANYG